MSDRLLIDDPFDVIGRIFAEASQDGWDAFREMIWLLANDPFPATSEVRNITVAQAMGGELRQFIAPFDQGRGLLFYALDQPQIILVDYVWTGS